MLNDIAKLNLEHNYGQTVKIDLSYIRIGFSFDGIFSFDFFQDEKETFFYGKEMILYW